MEPRVFRPPARVTIVAGKGGVGKTTVSAALAYLAASAGQRVLVVEVESASGLASLFGSPSSEVGYDEAVLLPAGEAGPGSASAEVRARLLTPDDALVEYLDDRGMNRISRRLTQTGTLDVIATAVPGIKDILVLGKVKQIELRMAAGDPSAPDWIIVDAPAAGHAVTFLSSAYGLLDAAAVGPIRAQAADVVGLLSDSSRCQVVLVTIPEETPVNEAVDTAFHLEDRAGVKLAPIVVNGIWPVLPLGDSPSLPAAEFRKKRQEHQTSQLTRLAERLPLEQLKLPFLFTTDLGLEEVRTLAGELEAQLSRVGWSG